MSFHSGRVTFCRFAVQGDAPATADEAALSVLSEFAFKEQSLGVPQEVEVGWVTGEHIFDAQFTYAKNGFGNALLFALRLDTHKVPSDIKQAYRRMHEQAMAAQKENPTGFLSKAEKRDVKDETDRQLHDELAAGKYRKSKMIPVLWDLGRKEVYFGAAGTVPVEHLHKLFNKSFNVDLESLTSGSMARRLMAAKGEHRNFEDLRPSAFTPPPPEATDASPDEMGSIDDPSIPFVPWTANSLDAKDFLGNEMLIWLWWISEEHDGMIKIPRPGQTASDEIALVLNKTLDMDCAWGASGKQTLRADGPTRLAEAAEALARGKWPRKAGMTLADVNSSEQWELTWQADQLIISSAQLPPIEDASSPREVVDARLLGIRRLGEIQAGLVQTFIESRTSSAWGTRRDAIIQWINKRRKTRTL